MSDLREILARKRDGQALSNTAISEVIAGVTSGALSDAQAGAFLMAIYLNGLSEDERVGLTHSMRNSGQTLSWNLNGPILDKHSTGGVGDTVSLILAPALAACGAYVPMISGKGLGHTGGTLDKLEAIPGYTITPSDTLFRQTVGQVGCAIVGQSDQLAPADRRLYALRDETASVGCIDLIVPSILSKKLAAGLDGLILDVKTGVGALVDGSQAKCLAQILVETGKAAGCATQAFLTDMSEPLASSAGNALEVKVALDLFAGTQIDDRLWDLTVALGGALLENNGLADVGQGGNKISDALQSGAAGEKFAQMVSALGGPSDLLEHPEKHLKPAHTVVEVYADETGFVNEIDTARLGAIVVELGGGRQKRGDSIDPSVGLDWIATRGSLVDGDQPIARVHAQTIEQAEKAQTVVKAAYSISQTPPDLPELILERLG